MIAQALVPPHRRRVTTIARAGQVSLIDTATRHLYPPITVGSYPVAVVISP